MEEDSSSIEVSSAGKTVASGVTGSIWGNQSFISSNTCLGRLTEMLSSEKPENRLASPVRSYGEGVSLTDAALDTSGALFSGSQISSSGEESEGPATRPCVEEDEHQKHGKLPREIFKTHSPKRGKIDARPLSKRGGKKGKGDMGVRKTVLKEQGKGSGQQKQDNTKERRVENLTNYTRARQIWGKLQSVERCQEGDKKNPCEGEAAEVEKMVKMGITYLDNFVKFDGHRKAMAAWRAKTKMEAKLGQDSLPDSVTNECRRALDRYQKKRYDLHGPSGSVSRRMCVRKSSRTRDAPASSNTVSRVSPSVPGKSVDHEPTLPTRERYNQAPSSALTYHPGSKTSKRQTTPVSRALPTTSRRSADCESAFSSLKLNRRGPDCAFKYRPLIKNQGGQ